MARRVAGCVAHHGGRESKRERDVWQVASLITVAAKFSHAIERIKHWEALDAAAAARA
jgi:hypothetical protein